MAYLPEQVGFYQGQSSRRGAEKRSYPGCRARTHCSLPAHCIRGHANPSAGSASIVCASWVAVMDSYWSVRWPGQPMRTHTRTPTHSLTHSHTHSLSFFLSLSLRHTQTHTARAHTLVLCVGLVYASPLGSCSLWWCVETDGQQHAMSHNGNLLCAQTHHRREHVG